MTRAEIRAQYAKYSSLERELLAQVIAMEKAGGAEQTAASVSQDQKVRDRARERLNGHGAQLMPAAAANSGATLSEIRIDLQAVRLIQETLTRAATAAAAIEATDWAEKHSREWESICRDFVIRAAETEALERRAEAYLEKAGEARFALQMSGWFGAAGVSINGESVSTIIKAAVDAGVVGAAEIRKAHNGKG